MSKKHILLIDDEENFGRIFKINLERTGAYEVELACDAIQGLGKLRAHTYDLVFLDVLMPKMEGGEALGIIRKETNVPVVIISAYLPPDKQREVLEAGASDSLQKPFNLDETLRVIHRVLEAQEKGKFLGAGGRSGQPQNPRPL